LQAIPAYIRTTNDENVMEMALVENIQREDLNAIEIALAYQHLLENTGMTQEKVAERVGKSRTAVTNHLRLLKLPAQVQMALQKKEIDMGHARALLAIDSPSQQLRVFRDIQKNGYSVRQVETLVKKINEGEEDGEKRPAKKQPAMPKGIASLRDKLSEMFSSKVEMTCSAKGKGKITIPFGNEKELERIMGVFEKLK
jgi:ParB family chromosome partitioning protein